MSVLIVDDMKSNLELLDVIFRAEGFDVVTMEDAHEALRVFYEREFDIALLDVMMPEMDGFELCRRIKEFRGNRFFPVVLLTALNDKTSKLAALESGADHFISKPFDKAELIAKIRSLIKLKTLQDELDHSENIILTLAVALESRDPYTKGHSIRVGELSKMFAEYLGLGGREQEVLRKAGYLHDIGKIAISEHVLCKGDCLTDDEMALVRKHVVVGENICRPLDSLKSILRAVRHHHERWDGKGFPDGISGDDIPLLARILSIVDSFDAMVSGRPYRERKRIGEALEIMQVERESGQWDPRLIGYFVDMVRARGEEFYRDD
ncbi:MAG: HD-GYP domain-containing protein [Thermodesulfovibrionales bacterium]